MQQYPPHTITAPVVIVKQTLSALLNQAFQTSEIFDKRSPEFENILNYYMNAQLNFLRPLVWQFVLHETELDIIFISLVVNAKYSCTICIKLRNSIVYVLNISYWTSATENKPDNKLKPKHALGATGMSNFIHMLDEKAKERELN